MPPRKSEPGRAAPKIRARACRPLKSEPGRAAPINQTRGMPPRKSEPGRAAPINPSRGMPPAQIRAGTCHPDESEPGRVAPKIPSRSVPPLCVFRLIRLAESFWSETVGAGRKIKGDRCMYWKDYANCTSSWRPTFPNICACALCVQEFQFTVNQDKTNHCSLGPSLDLARTTFPVRYALDEKRSTSAGQCPLTARKIAA